MAPRETENNAYAIRMPAYVFSKRSAGSFPEQRLVIEPYQPSNLSPLRSES